MVDEVRGRGFVGREVSCEEAGRGGCSVNNGRVDRGVTGGDGGDGWDGYEFGC